MASDTTFEDQLISILSNSLKQVACMPLLGDFSLWAHDPDIKKPPVAPKPKFALHLPLVPKPELSIANVMQPSKKPKPAIAPKPKVLKSSSFRESRPSSAYSKNSSLEELKGNRSESLDFLNCKNESSGEDNDAPSYIISVCSCNYKCIHKMGNGGNLYNTQTVFEQLEKLSLGNGGICRQPTPSAKTGWENENLDERETNRIVLNNCFRGGNVNNIVCRNLFSSSCNFKHKDATNDLQGKDWSCKNMADVGRVGSDQSLSSSEDCTDKQKCCKSNDGCEMIKICQSPKDLKEDSSPTDQVSEQNCKIDYLSPTKNVPSTCPQSEPSAHVAKVMPVPKPRKLRVACLVRQDCVDSPGDGMSEPLFSKIPIADSSEPVLKKFTKINILGQSVCYQEEPLRKVSSKNGAEASLKREKDLPFIEGSARSEACDTHNACTFTPPEENVEHSIDCDSATTAHLVDHNDDSSEPGTVERQSSFIRCCSLSMSLPKQLKITYNQHLSSAINLDSSNQDQEHPLKAEGSPSIAPKKPQRHSMPAAGQLKKASSEELLEKCFSTTNSERNSEGVADEIRLRHASAKDGGVLTCHNLPKRISEKPVWKLHRPILPFSGSPKSLKASSNSEQETVLTKPRAKSLSCVDIERIDKSSKDCSKKSTFKKLMNMKLSVCIMKSDFQRFLCKGSQSVDCTTTGLSTGDLNGVGQNGSTASTAGGKRGKPAKAQSAESYSTESNKKAKNVDKLDTTCHRIEPMGDQTEVAAEHAKQVPLDFVANPSTAEYENVRHYEEIPEYENLPFVLNPDQDLSFGWQNSSSVEDYDANAYEVQSPYDGGQRPLYDSRSSEEDTNLGIIHSDEEEGVNTSDEEGSSSDSSKGKLDRLEGKQSKRVRTQTKVYYIAKEIMSSEKMFVDVLKLLHIDFRNAVTNMSRQLGKLVIEEKVLNQILYYLPQLYELNRSVLRELEERLSHWSEQQKIADIFVTKGPYLKMYSTYIREFEKNIALFDEQCKRNPSFAAVVKEFEMSPRCANLALKHYLLKPVQRIPQYRLLLTGTLLLQK